MKYKRTYVWNVGTNKLMYKAKFKCKKRKRQDKTNEGSTISISIKILSSLKMSTLVMPITIPVVFRVVLLSFYMFDLEEIFRTEEEIIARIGENYFDLLLPLVIQICQL